MTYFEADIGWGNVDRETDRGICIDGCWLPKSQVLLTMPEEAWRSGTYRIPFWLACCKYTKRNVWAMIRAGSARIVED